MFVLEHYLLIFTKKIIILTMKFVYGITAKSSEVIRQSRKK